MEFSPYKFHARIFTFYEKCGLSFVTLEKPKSAHYSPAIHPAIIVDSSGFSESFKSAPRVLLGNKISLSILAILFFVHYAFTVVRALQYTFDDCRIQVLVSSSWSWVWLATIGSISYLTFYLRKKRLNNFLSQWKELDARVVESKSRFYNSLIFPNLMS